MTDIRTRTFSLERKAGKDNIFPAVATTEAPVLRDGFYEVLDMSRVDLSRAPLPFIESHDTNQVNIGVAEHLRVEGDKLRCNVRLGNSTRAKELAEDIKSGVVTGLSIGYRVSDGIQDGERDDYPVYRFAFTPHEVSAVSVPADINAGFFRSSTMETDEKLSRSERKRANMENRDEVGRTKEDRAQVISSLAEKHGLQEMGIRAISEDWSVSEFNQKALAVIAEENKNARQHTGFWNAGAPADNSTYGRAMDRYSLVQVLRNLADPAKARNSLEMEISEDMKRSERKGDSGSILVPYEALVVRAVTAGGSGSNLIGTDHLAGNFIDVLRNASHVMSLNPTFLPGLVGDVAIPKKSATTTAYWIAGDNSDSITASDPTLTQVTLSPKFVGGATTYSRKMLVQSAPGIEQIVRKDLADMIAVELDAKAIQGDGTGNTPTGVLNQSGINSVIFASSDPSYDELVSMETAIANDNATGMSMAWLTTPTLVESFKTTPRQATGVEGNFIWQDGNVCGYRCLSSKNVPDEYAILGDWSQLIVGTWGGIELDADPYGSNFLKGSVTVRVLTEMDFAVRHAEAFCAGHNNS